ncbi:hypothetical protein [Helicobacter sp.]|nr:hypothetical protein [Helicobacter sp.]
MNCPLIPRLLLCLWWGNEDLSNKANFKWQAMIAQPDFITQELFE